MIALSLAVVTVLQGSGHELSYALKESTIRYRFRGEVLSTYIGGVTAPSARKAEISGIYTLKTENQGGKWIVSGQTSELKATKDGKPLTAAETKMALGGVWRQTVGGDALYLVKGRAARVYALNAPLWPIAWTPLAPGNSLKIGDEFSQQFMFPAQAFLEDDPIGRVAVPIKFVFDGPEYPQSSGLFGVSIRTEAQIDQPVKHPEDPNLILKGKVLIDGRLKISRSDGRLQTASVIMSAEVSLEGKKYPFGFSKAKASVTENFERLQ